MWDRSCHLPSRLLHATCFFETGEIQVCLIHTVLSRYVRERFRHLDVVRPKRVTRVATRPSITKASLCNHLLLMFLAPPWEYILALQLVLCFPVPAFEEILAATAGLKALESSIDTPNLFVFCAKFLPWLYHREGQCLRQTGVSAYAKSPLSPLEKSRHTLHTLQLKVTPLYEASYARGSSKLRTPRLC